MIFLSAQPDDFYFLWQLELQIMNFKKCGILENNIHILLGYNKKKGLKLEYKNLITNNPRINFFSYYDKREKRNYPSSIRPNLISQHLKKFPELQTETIFYHDSDIIFRQLPDFGKLASGNCWYISDAKSYLDTNYIISSSNWNVFISMCDIVNISPKLVQQNNSNAGGAQYLLKNTTYEFWDKVEKDSEALFTLLTQFNNFQAENNFKENGTKRSEFKGIQAWCADMWSVLWNAWLFGNEVKIDSELDFCWPKDNIKRWNKSKILHYSGVTKSDGSIFFCKTNYTQYPPYDESLHQIDQKTCSKPIVALINKYKQIQRKKRVDLRDASFLIPVRIDSDDRLQNILLVTRWLDKCFDTNIIVGECDKTSKIQLNRLPLSCKLLFFKNDDISFNHAWVNNQLIKAAKTNIISIYDSDVVFPLNQMIEAINLIRRNKADLVSPYNGAFVSVDILFKNAFSKLTDVNLLYYNINKFTIATKRSWGGAVFIKKNIYIKAGGDNEFFKSWGPEDIERIKRMENLGYKVKRVEGPLFHLHHSRKINSTYSNSEDYIIFMKEYFKVCNMHKDILQTYIESWPWKQLLTT